MNYPVATLAMRAVLSRFKKVPPPPSAKVKAVIERLRRNERLTLEEWHRPCNI